MLLSEEETNVAEEMMIGTRDLDPLGLMSVPYIIHALLYIIIIIIWIAFLMIWICKWSQLVSGEDDDQNRAGGSVPSPHGRRQNPEVKEITVIHR